MNEIAVIMTVHNRKALTLDCLYHLYQETVLFDVYLTDDGCTDGTAEAIIDKYPNINIIKGDGTLFWNRGMYKAFAVALEKKYRFYLWLNDDTIVIHGFLEKLIETSIKEGEKSILCGACVDKNNSTIITYGGFTSNHQQLMLSDSLQQCFFACGNIFFIPSKVALILGNVDYYYKHSLGDFDYSVRANNAGILVYQMPFYLGFCKRHYSIPIWRDSHYCVKARFKHLYSPLGQNPFEFWHCDRKAKGIIYASFRFFILHIRCIVPKLWGNKYYDTI